MGWGGYLIIITSFCPSRRLAAFLFIRSFEPVSGEINQHEAASNQHRAHTDTHARAHKLLHIFEHNTIKHANIIIYLNNGGIPGPLNHRSTSYLFSCVNFFWVRCCFCIDPHWRGRNLGDIAVLCWVVLCCAELCCAVSDIVRIIANKNSEILFSHANVVHIVVQEVQKNAVHF